MGEIKKIAYDYIVPSEELFYYSLREFLLWPKSKPLLPPTMRSYAGKYVILDGHNRLIAQYLQGCKEVETYLPTYPTDEFPSWPKYSLEAIAEQNKNIRERWDIAVDAARKLNRQDFHEHVRRLQETFTFFKEPIPAICKKLDRNMMERRF